MKSVKIFLLLLCSASVISTAQPLIPYSTAIRNYAYIGKPGLNADATTISLFSSADPNASDGGFSAGTAISFTNGAAQNINAAGISQADGYLYGMEYLYTGPFGNGAKLYRVGMNAVAAMVGVVPGPDAIDAGRSIQFSFVNTASGTVDAAGNYWFTAYTFTDANTPFNTSKLDVFAGKIPATNLLIPGGAPLTPTYYKLDVSDPVLQTGYNNFMTSVMLAMGAGLPVSNVNGGWQDMDIHPASGKFFSYISFPSTTPVSPFVEPPLNSHLVRIDPVNSGGYWGKVSVINTTPNTDPNFEEDGAYFDAGSNYHVVFTNGQYASVNITTGAIGPLNATTLPLSGGQMRGDLATNTTANVPLPVVLLSFSGSSQNDGNKLSWKTGMETNLSHYIIEKSNTGKEFVSIATLGAKGNNNSYEYTDREARNNELYRLKMVNIGGEFSYSSIVSITSSASSSASIYPTIIQDNKIFVRFVSNNTTLRVTDMEGRIVLTAKSPSESSNYSASINLAPGTYLATLHDENGSVINSTPIIQK